MEQIQQENKVTRASIRAARKNDTSDYNGRLFIGRKRLTGRRVLAAALFLGAIGAFASVYFRGLAFLEEPTLLASLMGESLAVAAIASFLVILIPSFVAIRLFLSSKILWVIGGFLTLILCLIVIVTGQLPASS